MVDSDKTFFGQIKCKLKDFALYTSLHGLNRMVASKSVTGKLIWCLIFLTCTFLSGRQIFLLILQYTSNQVNTKIAMEYNDVYFPEVTFCNLNPLSHGKLKSTHKGRQFLNRLYTGDIYDKHLSTLWQTTDQTEEFSEGCVLASVDLVFILDSSSSVNMQNWHKMLRFCNNILERSDIDSGNFKVSVVTYNTFVSVQFYFNDFTNKEDVMNAISSIRHTGGLTMTHEALHITRTKVFAVANGDRADVKNIVILVTDGRPSFPNETLSEAKKIRSSGSTIFVVGIGMTSETTEDLEYEISSIASSPAEEHVFFIDDFEKLAGLEKKIFASLCPDFNALLNLQMEFRQNLMLYAYNMTLHNVTANLREFLIACSFNGRTCKKRSIMSVYDDFYGKCYRFPDEPQQVKDAGYMNGLQMIFNVNQSDYLPYVSDEAGVRLLVNPHGVPLSLERNGISVATGFRTSIALRQKSLSLLPKKSNCDDTGQFNSKDICVELCVEEQLEAKCNCTEPKTFKQWSNYSLCFSDEGRRCLLDVQRKCRRNICKIPCRQTVYETVLTMSTWPAEKFIYSSKFSAAFGENKVEFSKYKSNLLIVNIFFYDLSIEVTEEEYSITMENLLSSIGGSLGLWIGLSVITIGEFLEFFIILSKAIVKSQPTDKNDEMQFDVDMN